MNAYERSLKVYRDNYSIQETVKKEMRLAREEALKEGLEKERREEKIEIARMLKKNGVYQIMLLKIQQV